MRMWLSARAGCSEACYSLTRQTERENGLDFGLDGNNGEVKQKVHYGRPKKQKSRCLPERDAEFITGSR